MRREGGKAEVSTCQVGLENVSPEGERNEEREIRFVICRLMQGGNV